MGQDRLAADCFLALQEPQGGASGQSLRGLSLACELVLDGVLAQEQVLRRLLPANQARQIGCKRN